MSSFKQRIWVDPNDGEIKLEEVDNSKTIQCPKCSTFVEDFCDKCDLFIEEFDFSFSERDFSGG